MRGKLLVLILVGAAARPILAENIAITKDRQEGGLQALPVQPAPQSGEIGQQSQPVESKKGKKDKPPMPDINKLIWDSAQPGSNGKPRRPF
jgi:hypothetical protein